MPRATSSAALVGIAALAGCGRGDLEYAQAFVAQRDAGPVLMLLDRWTDGYVRLSDVDIMTGARGYPQVIGVDALCLPASTAKIWCGYTVGDAQFEHEQWALGTWDVLANNDAIAGSGPLTVDQIQANQGLAIRKVDRALVLIGDSADTWAVDPDSLSVTPWSQFSSDDESSATVPDDAQEGVSRQVQIGGKAYAIDDNALLKTAPAGSTNFTPVSTAESFFAGAFVVADGFDASSPPIVAQGPESLIIASAVSQDATSGWQIARVATADGMVLWRLEVPDAQWIDTLSSTGGVLVAVFPTTPVSTVMPPPLRHAHVKGLDLATGEVRWALDL
jgi:hypothetical protein